MEILLALGVFGLAMFGMSLGVIVSGRALRGSCGGVEGDDLGSCGACARKDNEVCPTDEPLVALSQIAHPDPRFHR